MIPFFTLREIHLFGPLAIKPYAVFLTVGICLGYWLVHRRTEEAAIPQKEIRNAVIWAMVFGFVGAHLAAILLYHPELIERDGYLVLLKVWTGSSSFGGIAGGLIGLIIYFRRLNKPWLVQAEIMLQGLVAAWIFGRLGCTFAHDHIGNQTSFFLAFQYPAGARHNLGFYEFLLALLVLFPVVLILHRRRAKPGSYLTAISLIYAPVRFGLDFLRITGVADADARYRGLTPAQFGCIALFVYGLWMFTQGDFLAQRRKDAKRYRVARGFLCAFTSLREKHFRSPGLF